MDAAALCLQIGTGYFGCRNNDTGGFDPDKFAVAAARPQVKMIEVKLSQGAKPSHGGILPAAKISPAIAEARGIPSDRDCNSPPHHAEFSTPRGLLDFVARLRVLSDGKPIGLKLCVGHPVRTHSIETHLVADTFYAPAISAPSKWACSQVATLNDRMCSLTIECVLLL